MNRPLENPPFELRQLNSILQVGLSVYTFVSANRFLCSVGVFLKSKQETPKKKQIHSKSWTWAWISCAFGLQWWPGWRTSNNLRQWNDVNWKHVKDGDWNTSPVVHFAYCANDQQNCDRDARVKLNLVHWQSEKNIRVEKRRVPKIADNFPTLIDVKIDCTRSKAEGFMNKLENQMHVLCELVQFKSTHTLLFIAISWENEPPRMLAHTTSVSQCDFVIDKFPSELCGCLFIRRVIYSASDQT